MRTRRLVVLSLLPLLAACGAPGAGAPAASSPEPTAVSTAPRAARKPTVLVATGEGHGMVRVDLGASVELTPLLPDGYPTHVEGSRVAYVVTTEGGMESLYADVGVVDPSTGEHRMLTSGGQTVQVLHSPDGKHRYVLRSGDQAVATSLSRTDADGGNRTDLVPKGNDFFWLSHAALSPDGRTLYVARTEDDKPSALLAIDTATGRQRVIDDGTPFELIASVVASPDGRLLAVTIGALGRPESGPESHVALVPTGGGESRLLKSAADLRASGFSRDGGHVVLTHTMTKRRADHATERRHTLALADVATGRIERIKGTDGLQGAVSLD